MARHSKRGKAALIALTALVPLPKAHAAETHRAPLIVAHTDSNSDAAVERAAQTAGLSLDVLRAALGAYRKAALAGAVKRAVLTVIDYSLPSHVRRLWVLDLMRAKVLAHELVAHGRGSGEDIASRFSNSMGSLETSLGAFVTADRYEGKNGLSLRLEGLNPGLNDKALERGIVVHGAWYVGDDIIRKSGRLGRSEGCPALSPAVAPTIIAMIEGGSVLYAHYSAPDARAAHSL